LGLTDAKIDLYALVTATIPSNQQGKLPVVAFNSHVDTSPETTGKNVKPQVIESYAGGDIVLPGDPSKVIRASECSELEGMLGKTLITTDGTTLLGADDKAGLAVIMEMAAMLIEHPEIPHGDVRILFTCDEEIGHGVDHVDLKELGADACYTLDGSSAEIVDVETFSADQANVTIRGINIHPSIAKDRMVNAIRAAAHFVEQMPKQQMAPEVTAGRDGFLHPYRMRGGVDCVTIHILLRDFETQNLAAQARLLDEFAAETRRAFPGVEIDIEIQQQYRNMRDGLEARPEVVANAQEAWRRLGRTADLQIIRGGTDGSQLTALGLPTPNLSSGQHTPHSPLEWACLDEMELAVAHLVELVQVWAG
jgi:tripeptide aminopeptidase